MLDYPLISMTSLPNSPIKQYVCTGMFGTGYSEEDLLHYDAVFLMEDNYPPVYLAKALDDSTIPGQDTKYFEEALNNHNIPHCFRYGKTGEHGFGLGTNTP